MQNFELVQKIISEELGIEPDTITMESDLIEDLGADSVDLIEMVSTFEDELGISIDDEELDNIKTVKDVLNVLEKIV